jgi:hypothetical protein
MVLGLGMTISVAPITTTVMNAVRKEQAGIASGINNAISRVAAVLAIAVLGVVMLITFNRHLDNRLIALDLTPEVRQRLNDERLKMAAIEVPPGVDAGGRVMIERSIHESFVAGFRLVMLVASGLAVASAACAWLIIEDNRRRDRI